MLKLIEPLTFGADQIGQTDGVVHDLRAVDAIRREFGPSDGAGSDIGGSEGVVCYPTAIHGIRSELGAGDRLILDGLRIDRVRRERAGGVGSAAQRNHQREGGSKVGVARAKTESHGRGPFNAWARMTNAGAARRSRFQGVWQVGRLPEMP